ncbi:MAG: hypothetical protein QOI47_629 [Actinomycetota bacterium]|nr:hypothetical protein [Actinomycetota bacterium]
MSATRRVVTALVIVAAAGILGLVLWTLTIGGARTPAVREAASNAEGLSVGDAVNRAPTVSFAVRGFVVDDGAFVQLCESLLMTKPPKCRGPVMLVRNLDLARLNLKSGTRGGRRIRYTDQPVILGGRVDGTQLSVEDVLGSAAP